MRLFKTILADLWVWATGWPHLWNGKPHGRAGGTLAPITYKPGWGPWKFALMYATTYLAGTLAGYGVVSLSRAWYERSHPHGYHGGPKYPFARFMTRLLNWLVPGKHGVHTGPWLWNTASRRPLVY
jgi:hypothetical protein